MNIHYKKLVLCALVLGMVQALFAQEKVSKRITRSFAMTDDGSVQLENRYGNINVYGWDREELSIEIFVTVNHRKKENAEDLLKRISPEIRNSSGLVSVAYRIGERKKGFFAELWDSANPFDFDRSNIQIDYTVKIPRKTYLELDNTFGNVVIEGWKGRLKANVGHGDLWLNDPLASGDIKLEYGRLNAKSIKKARIEIRNGELDMDSADTLRLEGDGSEVRLKKVASFEIYSNRDKVFLEEVGKVYGNLSFTTVDIGILERSVDMNMKVSELSVAKITNPEAQIFIAQESSDIDLNVIGYPHRFTANLEEGLVRLPKSYHNVDTEMLDIGKELRTISADYGKVGKGSISIKGSKGSVVVKEL